MKFQSQVTWLAVVVLSACRDPTQITFEITTDVPCGDVNDTSIAVGVPGEVEDTSTTATTRCVDGRIGSIVVVPSSGTDAEIGIRMATGVGVDAESCAPPAFTGCIVARRALRYVPHTPLFVPVTMRSECRDVPCGATTTCVEGGACATAEILRESRCATRGVCDEDALAVPPPVPCVTPPCEAVVVLESLSVPVGVALTPTHVYFSEEFGGISRLNRTSGEKESVVSATGHYQQVAVRDQSLYWGDYTGEVWRSNLDGSASVRLVSGQGRVVGVGASDTVLYWTLDLPSPAGEIRSTPLGGGAVETFVGGRGAMEGIAVATDGVYFAAFEDGEMGFAPFTGAPRTLVPAAALPSGVALHAGHVYYTLQAAGELRRVAIDGTGDVAMSTGHASLTGVAADDQAVYFADHANGLLLQLTP